MFSQYSRRVIVAACLACALALLVTSTATAAITASSFSTGSTSDPDSLVSGPDGNLYFTDTTGSVGRVSTSGTIARFTGGLNMKSMPADSSVVGPDGNVWFCDTSATTPAIGKLDLATGAVTEYPIVSPKGSPSSIVAGPGGDVWFIVGGSVPAIGKITPAGAITEITAGFNSMSELDFLTVGPDGNLWFTDLDNADVPAVGKLTPSGTSVSEFPTGTGTMPTSITAGPDGNVWFSVDGKAAIGRVTPDGTVSLFSDGLNANADPDDITSGPGQTVWFDDQNSSEYAVGEVKTGAAPTIQEFDLDSNTPWSLGAGDDGNIWLVQSNQIVRITPSGAMTKITSGLSGVGADGDGVVSGPDGNIWYNDRATKSIIRVDLDLKPVASTGSASAVTSSTATVSGMVTPLTSSTSVSIDYGPTPALGLSQVLGTLPASDTSQAVSGTLSGLEGSGPVYYAVVATNASGTTTGSTQMFTTANVMALPPTGTAPPGTVPPGSAGAPVSTHVTFDQQRLTLTHPPVQPCLAPSASLALTFTSSGSSRSVHFSRVTFTIDKGKLTRRRRTVISKGHKRTKLVVGHGPNATVRHSPASVAFALSAVPAGAHTVKVRAIYRVRVKKHGHPVTETKSKTLTVRFTVC